MGLVLRVPATPDDVRRELSGRTFTEMAPEAIRILDWLDPESTHGNDCISLSVGGYSGMHRLRAVAEESGQDCPHLQDHSDCDGWYLPENFVNPVMVPDAVPGKLPTSIGSSRRLLTELWSIRNQAKEAGYSHEWSCFFICAVASVAMHVPVKLC